MKPTFTSRLMFTVLAMMMFAHLSIGQQTETISLAEDRIRHMLSDFQGTETVVEICDLKAGETYRVWAVQTNWCQPTAQLIGGGAPAATFDFVAETDCVEMLYSKGDTPCEGEMYLSLDAISLDGADTKGKKGLQEAAALFISDGYTSESLIKDIFIGGGCFDIENVQAIGPNAGRGRFGSGAASIVIESGVILESGNVFNALGPNNSNSAGNNIGGGGDPDLQQIATAGVFDAVGIEFDFTPTVDSMTFEFVFASEEYCEYVNSTFNDVFGFFISGPGFAGPFSNGGVNIATLPGGGQVAINSVNHLANQGFFVPNQDNCGGFFNQADIQFDGYTVPLEAKAILQACETYHIRLVVGDAGDGIFDSAVFLKANSFNAGNALQGDAISASTGTNLIYEACNDGTIYFYRAAGDVSVPLIYDVVIDPSSTATPGLDYSGIPSQVIIPPGQTFVEFPLNIVDDGIPEGIETIILLMDNTCSCTNDEIVIEIADSDPIELNLEPEVLCVGEVATLNPSPTGGTGNFTFEWSDGSTDPILVVVPPGPPTYAVTVTDNCGSQGSTSTTITVNQLPTANISGDPLAFLCAGDQSSTVDLEVTFTGGAPWTFVYSIDGVPQPPITTMENPYIITTNSPGAFEMVSVASSADCDGTAFGVAVVQELTVSTELQADPSTCILGGTLFANFNGGAPSTYQWSDPTLPNPNGPIQIDVAPGTYAVTITDLNGCTAEDEAIVEEIIPLTASSSFTNIDCSTGSAGTIEVTANSGSEPISYNWSNGLPNSATQNGLGAGTYYVTIFDNIGCTILDSMTIENNATVPAAVAAAPTVLDCNNLNTEVFGTGSSTGNNISYQWSGPGVVSGATEINATVDEAGTYTIVVTDNDSGCTSTDEVEVSINNANPTATAAGNQISCTVDEVDLNGTGSSVGPNFTYQWSGPGIVSGGTTLIPTVDAAGTYTIVVTNTDNGCTEEATADVTQSNDLPTAVITDPETLDCNTNTLVLDGSGSSSGTNITYQWYENGAPIPGEISTSLSVGAPGNYEIVVVDGDNGCESNYAVEVEEDVAPPPVTATADGQFTCTLEEVGLTANVPGSPANYTYDWSTVTGSFVGGTNAQNATAASPGEYEVFITNTLNGCTATATVDVDQDASIPMVEIEPAEELNCLTGEIQLDGTNSTQGANLTYTWTATGGGNITAGQNSLTPTVNAAGTYILTIVNSGNGCESEEEITVSADNINPDLDVAAAPELDCETLSLVFDASVSNFPLADLNILWTTSGGGVIDGPNDILNAETSTPGTYTLTVTNINNGCTDVVNVAVGQDNTPPDAAIENPNELDCTNNTVTLDGGASSTGSNYTYEWSTSTGNLVSGSNTLFPVVNQDGPYTLVVTNTENNCTATETVNVEQNADVPEAEAGLETDFTCDIEQMNLSGDGSTGAEYTYQWIGPGVLNGGTTLNPLVDEPGTYTLIVTNQTNQCTAADDVVLGTDFTEPMAEAGDGGQLSCSVTAMSLDGTGSSMTDVSYLWTSPDGSFLSGQTTLSPEINAPGTYILTVTNNLNGCTSEDDVLIEEDDDLPGVDIELAPPITCDIFEITLDGTDTETGPTFTYVWGTTGGNIVNGANTLEPLVDAPGTYSLTVTNTATNCTNIGSVTVAEDTDAPAAEAGVTLELTCDVTDLVLNGGGSSVGAGINYLWNTSDGNIYIGETTLNPSINEPGTYTILVTDSNNGCTSTDEVVVTQNVDEPTAVAIAVDELTCDLSEVAVSATGSSSGSVFTYQWSTADGNIVSGGNSVNAIVDEPGTYELIVSNSNNGCTSVEQVDVTEDVAEPTAEAGMSVNLDCDTETLDLDASGSSTGAGYTYQWTTVDGDIVSGGNTLSPTVGEVGTYVLIVTNTQNGCSSDDQVQVGEDANLPSVDIASPPNLTCAETVILLSGSASQGSNFEYTWSTTNGNIVSGNQTLDPEIDEPGTYTLFVINNDNGCTNEASINVSEDVEEPTANAGIDFLMDCLGNSPSLNGLSSTGSGSLIYTWETTNGNIESGADTPEPVVSQSGDYILIVTDASNGCTDSDEVTVSSTGPSADPETLQPGCFGQQGAIVVANVSGGSSPYLFSIDGGNTFTDDAIHTNLDPGTYQVVVQDAIGCTETDQIVIEQPALFQVDILEATAEIDQGDQYQLDVEINVPMSEVSQIIWNPTYGLSCTDCLDPFASPEQSTVYHVRVKTTQGCEDDAVMLLQVNEEADIYVPNAFNPFSPNEVNQKFTVFTDENKNLKVRSLLVFSRWGETVFENYNFEPNNLDLGWDGMYRGELMNPAVFVWMVEIEFEDGRVELFKGDVNLLH